MILGMLMNTLKRFLGIVWILLGLGAVWYLIYNQAVPLWKAGGESIIPAVIYVFVLCPIIAGSLGCFGWFAWQGEFDE